MGAVRLVWAVWGWRGLEEGLGSKGQRSRTLKMCSGVAWDLNRFPNFSLEILSHKQVSV
jgi:hypothetical protein